MRFTSAKFFAIIFSILMVASVAVVPTFIYAVDETAIEQEALNKVSSLKLIDCNSSIIWSGMDCLVPQLAYFLLYIPAMGLLMLGGYIFDFVLSLSIDHNFIDQPFVNKLWGIIRDFSNMIFIFVLLYTGVQTIFGMGKWQQTIIKVVIVALLVNFSMFFTKVVIDAGNILAVGIYQGMGATKVAGIDRPHKTEKMGNVPERTVSATLVNALNPQQFSKLSADNKSGAATIFVISAIVCAFAAYIFVKASLLFIGRIIAFWFLMAISPFALISMALPKGNIWGWWTNTLINQSFVAPVFLIFIYFIMTAIKGLDTVLMSGDNTGKSFFDSIVISVVVTVMVIYALKRALGVAEDMSDKFGKIGADAIGKAMSSFPMGMAGGLALGGGAALLRRTVGSSANKVLKSGALQQMTINPNSRLARFTGRTLHGVAEKAQTSTFDARNTDAMKWALKNAGKELGGANINLGKVGNKGGYKGALEQSEKDAKAQAEKMKVTDAEKAIEAAKIDPKYKEAKEKEDEHLRAQTRTTIAHDEAKSNLENTNEWKEHQSLEKNIASKRSNFKSTSENLVKKIEDLKKKQAAEKWPDEKDKLQEEIIKTEEEGKRAQAELSKEEQKLIDAKDAYEKTVENIKLKETTEEFNWAKDKYEETKKIIKDTEKKLEYWEDEENQQRRQFSADNSMNSFLSSNRYFVSKVDRASVVKKIRKGDDKEKKKEEKRVKDLIKYLNEKEKKEAKEEKPEEEKKE